MEESSKTAEIEVVLETLRRRGWVIRDTEVKAIAVVSSALVDDRTTLVDSLESELLNMDLRSIGSKSLPDISHLRKSSYLDGPKVLQISSVRDISRSSIDELSKSSSSRRLLRLNLTDGHSEITSIEYSQIPSIPDNVVPGTKIRVENKAAVHSGILCLTPKVVEVLGGIVPELYDEWKMNQKYSGISRSSLRLSHDGESGGPPPFEKLNISSDYARSKLQNRRPVSAVRITETAQTGEKPRQELDSLDINPKVPSHVQKNEDKPSSSATRPKEVVESNPIQNQAAAQKLLQKMSQDKRGGQHSRGRQRRGKGRQEEEGLTLEEYENKIAQAKEPTKAEIANISRDEELALQLQNQFDLEDYDSQWGSHSQATEAEDIRMSMFRSNRDYNDSQGGEFGRGGGRGRGRGKGRGRGRGRRGRQRGRW